MTKQAIKDTLSGKKDILQKYQVKSLGLFGSFARNQQRKNSDIDLLVVFKKPTFDNYIGLRDDLKKVLRRKVDLVSLKALKNRIKSRIIKETEWI